MFVNKKKLVQEIFTSVAVKYDLMNDLMSLGVHRWWKKKFVAEIPAIPHTFIIDVAGGTGDIAGRFLKNTLNTKALICDRNFEMIKAGQAKLIDQNIQNVKWVCSEAENLPFRDQLFDCYTISFGIRNAYDIPLALQEAYRVLKCGGKFMCLEFGHPQNKVLSMLYKCYSNKFIPFLGKKVASNQAAYDYLVSSISQFPTKETFIHMINRAGFSNIEVQDLSGGIVNIYTAWRY